jgi:myotubularin-related protein 1/2
MSSHTKDEETLTETNSIHEDEISHEKSEQMEEILKQIEIKLFLGEKIFERDNSVFDFDGTKWNQGAFLVTNYRVLFYPGKLEKNADPISLPLCSIHKLEKLGGKTTSKDMAYSIEISMKDGRTLKYSFLPKKNTRGKIVKLIKKELLTKEFFAFSYKFPLNNDSIDGWEVYDEQIEFDRQGALEFGMWRISNVNDKFAISETYPRIFCVPNSVSDSDIKTAAHFRSKGRLPVLTWYDKNTGASLTRSSQPLIGINIQNKKNKEDVFEFLYLIQVNWFKVF